MVLQTKSAEKSVVNGPRSMVSEVIFVLWIPVDNNVKKVVTRTKIINSRHSRFYRVLCISAFIINKLIHLCFTRHGICLTYYCSILLRTGKYLFFRKEERKNGKVPQWVQYQKGKERKREIERKHLHLQSILSNETLKKMSVKLCIIQRKV